MRPRIFVTQPVAKSALDRLRKVASVKVFPDASRIIPRRTLIAAVRKCDILFCLLHDRIDRAVIEANPKLRMVAAQSISPSNIDVAAATARRIPVTVVPPVTTEATADLTFGLMIAVARRMMEGDRLVRAGKFPGGQSRHLLGSFYGPTIGLDRRRRPDWKGGGAPGAWIWHARALLDAAAQAGKRRARGRPDFRTPFDRCCGSPISSRCIRRSTRRRAPDRRARASSHEEICVPYQYRARRDHRRGSAGARAQNERIAGAGLDVFEHEPKVDAALRKMPNVALAPHLGSATTEVREEMANIVVDNILAFLDGKCRQLRQSAGV